MNKKIKIGLGAIVIVILIVVSGFFISNKKQTNNLGSGVASLQTYTTASSSRISIGAGTDTRAVATSSRRAHIEITNDCTSVVYLVLNNDAPADTGIRLNANGGSFTMTPDAMYTGSIRATSSAACNINAFQGTF